MSEIRTKYDRTVRVEKAGPNGLVVGVLHVEETDNPIRVLRASLNVDELRELRRQIDEALVGSPVKAGGYLGRVSTTSVSTGPHLSAELVSGDSLAEALAEAADKHNVLVSVMFSPYNTEDE